MAGRSRNGSRHGGNGGSVPPPWLSGWFDAELRDLFREEPELYETAHRLRASRPDASANPRYRARLRVALMTEAEGALGRRRARRWFIPRAGHLAWGGAAAGVALVAATALAVFSGHVQDHETIVASSNVAAQHAVSPDDVITVAFNQPMDHAAVVAGLKIQPATRVTTRWQGENLVITPVYHLAGNTPYTVSIAQPNLRSTVGTVAAAPVEITFGTAPTPPPAEGATPPTLVASSLGQATSGSGLAFAPDGSVVSTSGIAPASNPASSSQASASPGSTPPGTASPSPSGSATPSPNQATPGSPSLLEFPAGGGAPRALAAEATAVAFAPHAGTLAAVLSDGAGGSRLVVSSGDGSAPTTLLRSPSPISALAWASVDRIVYATGDGVHSIDLSRTRGPVIAPPAGAGALQALSPDGTYAYLSPAAGTGGTLWNIASGATIPLTGAVSQVLFSGDGGSVAWVDQSAARPRLLLQPVDRAAPATVSTVDPGAGIQLDALSENGSEVAYTVTAAGAPPQLVVAQAPSGSPLATGPAATTAAFSSGGGSLALLVPQAGGAQVELASIPGAGATAGEASVPAAATDTLNAFVEAQVRGDGSTLGALSGPGVEPVAATPGGLSRGYVVDAEQQGDGSVAAQVELIVDSRPAHPAPLVSNETVILQPSASGQYTVSSLDVAPLRQEAGGPHVVRVSSGGGAGNTTLQVTFDSDLAASTVSGSIAVEDSSGAPVPAAIAYDAATRTAVVTLGRAYPGELTISVGTSLLDVDGNALAAAFTAHVTAG